AVAQPGKTVEAAPPQPRSLQTATAAIAIVLPKAEDERHEIGIAYDDGRAAERVLIAGRVRGRGGGSAWTRPDVRPPIGELLGLPADRYIRTIISLGHPTEAALAPKAAPGEARLPRDESIFRDLAPGCP